MAYLSLTDGVRTRVWRVVKAQIQADLTYEDAGIKVIMADGPDREVAYKDLTTYDVPVVRVTPRAAGGGEWYAQDSLKEFLVVHFEVCLRSPDREDLMNLQYALEGTLSAIADTTFQADATREHATTGLVTWPKPLDDPRGARPRDDGLLLAEGQCLIECERPF